MSLSTLHVTIHHGNKSDMAPGDRYGTTRWFVHFLGKTQNSFFVREPNTSWIPVSQERKRDACAEEWLRGGAAARGEPTVLCGGRAVAVRYWCEAPARRSGCVEERPREENLRCWCGAVAVRCWCGAVVVRRAVLLWCGVVVGKRRAKRMKKTRRRKGEMREKPLREK